MRNLLFVAVMGIAAAGCGSQQRTGSDPVYPVTGVISYKGRPVSQAEISFYNAEKNRSAFGKTNDKGEYQLTTFSPNDGAVEGQHVVMVVKIETPPESMTVQPIESEAYVPPGFGQSTEPKPPKSDLPEKYANQATSGLTAIIKTDGPNQVDFDLE